MAELERLDGQRRSARAFRIVAGVLGVLLALLVVAFAVGSTVSSDPEQTVHRFHNTGGGLSTLIVAAALILLARRPAGNPAAMQLLVVGAIVSLAAGLLGGDLIGGLYFLPAVFVAILYVLYPWKASVRRVPAIRPGMLGVAIVAAISAVAYALTQAALQRNALPGDVHAEMHHYSGVALSALAIPASVLVAGVGAAGWRAVAWIGAMAFLVFGLSGVVYSSYMSAPDDVWSWASIAAGIATAVATEIHARRPAAA